MFANYVNEPVLVLQVTGVVVTLFLGGIIGAATVMWFNNTGE